MLSFFLTSFLPPFLLTFLLPGTILALSLIRKQKINFILFLLYLTVFGLASQFIIALLTGPIKILDLSLKNQVIAASLIFLIIIIFSTKTYKIKYLRENLGRISFSFYDLLAILLTIILLISFSVHVKNPENPLRFLSQIDTYLRLAKADYYLNHPMPLLNDLIKSPIKKNPIIDYKPGFSLVMSPYIAFLKKDFDVYQQFILAAVFLLVGLLTLALAQLGKMILPSPFLGLLAPLIVFSYYLPYFFLLGQTVMPHNIGLPLFIIGIIFINEYNIWKNKYGKWLFLTVFALIFYFIYVYFFGMFLIIAGLSLATLYVIKLFKSPCLKPIYLNLKSMTSALTRILIQKKYLLWGLAILIFFISVNYFFYIYYYINIYSIKNFFSRAQTFWIQPYQHWFNAMIIWLAVLGLLIASTRALFSKENPGKKLSVIFVIITFATATLFLKTQLVSAIFYFQPDPFRFFSFINTSAGILALYPFAWAMSIITKRLSKISAAVMIAAILLTSIPLLLLLINERQSSAFSVLVSVLNNDLNLREGMVRETLAVSQNMPTRKGNILWLPYGNNVIFANWAFTPAKSVLSAPKCQNYNKQCLLRDDASHTFVSFSDADISFIIIEKKYISNVLPLLEQQFKNFLLYKEYPRLVVYQKSD